MQTTSTATPTTSRQIVEIGLLLDRLGLRRSVSIAARRAGLNDEPRTALEAARIIGFLRQQLPTA
jgi:hypothetical protein